MAAAFFVLLSCIVAGTGAGPVVLEEPPFEYTLAAEPEERISLRVVDSSAAGVTDLEDWFAEISYPALTFHGGGINDAIRGSSVPRPVPESISVDGEGLCLYQLMYASDMAVASYGLPPNRFCVVLDPRVLVGLAPDGSGPAWVLDFSSYLYAPGDDPDGGALPQAVRWAEVHDGVLYVSNYHRTYATNTGGRNAYVTAIRLADMELLWRSRPLVCNSHNFLLTEGSIICGYGFTDESDFLYLLDRETGEVYDSVAVQSAPEYLAVLGSYLYVRCYDAEYVFEMVEE